MDDYLIARKNSLKDIRLTQNVSLDKLSTCTGIQTIDLERYESIPSDIPIEDAIKLLGYYKINFERVRFH